MQNAFPPNHPRAQASSLEAPGVLASPVEDEFSDSTPAAPSPPVMRMPGYLYPLPSSRLAHTRGRPKPARGFSLAGLLLGLASILLWMIPGLGVLLAGAACAFSLLSWRATRHNRRKWMVIVGCALSLAALALSVYNLMLRNALFPH